MDYVCFLEFKLLLLSYEDHDSLTFLARFYDVAFYSEAPSIATELLLLFGYYGKVV